MWLQCSLLFDVLQINIQHDTTFPNCHSQTIEKLKNGEIPIYGKEKKKGEVMDLWFH
jgi:hypothetical protein